MKFKSISSLSLGLWSESGMIFGQILFLFDIPIRSRYTTEQIYNCIIYPEGTLLQIKSISLLVNTLQLSLYCIQGGKERVGYF